MQIPLKWINELLDLYGVQLELLIEKLTLGGFEVEDILEREINNKKEIILDISATANRSDSLSIQAISFEISTLFDKPIKISNYLRKTPNWKIANQDLFHNFVDNSQCSIFLAIVIENVTDLTVPKWIKQKLLSSGASITNNLLDFQTYILLETGYPFSFYDFNKISFKTKSSKFHLSVSPAQDEQKFLANNGIEYNLDNSISIVNANTIPISIAGIIEEHNFSYSTNSSVLLIEGSIYAAVKIRQQSRKLNLRTDRSARYEKSLKSTYLKESLYRLICLLRIANPNLRCKLHTASQTFEKNFEAITLKYSNINQILGPIYDSTGLPTKYLKPTLISDYLTRLNFKFIFNNDALMWSVVVPSTRMEDITREVDIIEEIGRLYGFNNFLTILPKRKTVGKKNFNYRTRKKVTSCLLNFGFNELIHYSLVNEITGFKNQIKLINPLVSEYAYLRTSLLPSLIKTWQDNFNQKNRYLEGFEYGHVFEKDLRNNFKEKENVAGIFGGVKLKLTWSESAKELSWYEAKGKMEQLFQELNFFTDWVRSSNKTMETWFHPNRTAEIYLKNKIKLGIFGQINPIIASQLNISQKIYLFEFDLERITKQLQKNTIVFYKNYSLYPKIIKNLSFIVKKDITFEKIQQLLYLNGTEILSEVNLIDEYQGQSISNGHISLCLELIFNSSKTTLENKDVDLVLNKLEALLLQKFEVSFRQ